MIDFRPSVYCASPAHRIKMWQRQTGLVPDSVRLASTWHDNDDFDADDQNPAACERYWSHDLENIRAATVLLAYAEHKDRPNGTLVEIGYALSFGKPIYLVGNFQWGTWRYIPLVSHHSTLREAFERITGGTLK